VHSPKEVLPPRDLFAKIIPLAPVFQILKPCPPGNAARGEKQNHDRTTVQFAGHQCTGERPNKKVQIQVDEKEVTAVLTEYETLGRLGETPDILDARLHGAVEGAAARAGMHSTDLGFVDWAEATIKKVKKDLHNKLCDPAAGTLNPQYKELADMGTSKEAIASVSSVITSVLVGLHLTPLIIPSVVIYLAIWLLKTGLNSWCSRPMGPN
jgi:hypothetical protein